MKKSRFTLGQVAYVLRQAKSWTTSPRCLPQHWDIASHLLSLNGFLFVILKKYDDLGAREVRRLRQLEEENLRLKRLVADLTLDRRIICRR